MNKKTITKALPFSLAMSTLTTMLLAIYDGMINHIPINGIKTLIFFILVFLSSLILVIFFPNMDKN